MRDPLSLYRRLIGAQIRSQMVYRASFLAELTSTALITTLEFGAIALVFSRFGDIGGWSLGELAFIFGLVEFAFGLMDLIFSGFDPPHFGQEVRLGNFDRLLLRPINITLQVLGSRFFLHRLGKVALGLAIVIGAVGRLGPIWTPGKLLYLPFVTLGMVCFFGGLFIIGATITFWTIESIEAVNIFTYGGQTMISYPMHIYQDWMRRFFTFVLPAIFLNYYPALYILDKPDPLGFPAFAPFLSPFVGVAILSAALVFWRFGIRHYKSTGT
jgi:ABC-2 type transport system permease protein